MTRIALVIVFGFFVFPSFVSTQNNPSVAPVSPPVLKACGVTNPPPCATTPPHATHHPEPKYSKEARKKKLQGTAVLDLVVGADGRAHDIRVTQSLGYGLDEEAIKAVQKWKFVPAADEKGVPVPVAIKVEITFRLY